MSTQNTFKLGKFLLEQRSIVALLVLIAIVSFITLIFSRLIIFSIFFAKRR